MALPALPLSTALLLPYCSYVMNMKLLANVKYSLALFGLGGALRVFAKYLKNGLSDLQDDF